jgi:hypothetical protein
MPGSYTILPEARFVYSRFWGNVTDQHLQAHARALQADPRFESSFAQLTDFRDVSGIEVTTDGIRVMTRLNPFGRGARRAILAPGITAFGLARMYELMKLEDDDQIQVVREVSDALRWLGARAPAGWNEMPLLPYDWITGDDQPEPPSS